MQYYITATCTSGIEQEVTGLRKHFNHDTDEDIAKLGLRLLHMVKEGHDRKETLYSRTVGKKKFAELELPQPDEQDIKFLNPYYIVVAFSEKNYTSVDSLRQHFNLRTAPDLVKAGIGLLSKIRLVEGDIKEPQMPGLLTANGKTFRKINLHQPERLRLVKSLGRRLSK